MILKSTLLAVVVFLGSLTVAEAQSQSYVNGGIFLGWGGPGWNFNTISQCLTVNDGTNTWYYAFFGASGAMGYIYTNNPGFAPIIAAACQGGNLFGINVSAFTPSLVWTQVTTFPSK